MGREHWVDVRIGDICLINPRHKNIPDNEQVSFVTMADIKENSTEFRNSTPRAFSEVKSGFTHFKENDVLFAKITPCMENGKGAIAKNLINGIGCGTTELHVLRPLYGIDSLYIYFYLYRKSFRDEAKRNFTGSAGQQRVPVEFIKSSIVPLPPLNEQARIVTKLDAILPRVKKTKERLEKIPRILKLFRQSVLSAACTGRLTEEWREEYSDIEDVSILFERIKRTKYIEFSRLCDIATKKGKRKPKSTEDNKISKKIVGEIPEIPQSWNYYRLDDISHLVTDGTHMTPKYYRVGKPFLSVKNIRPFLIKDTDIKFISEDEFNKINRRCNPEKGDILYTKVGTYGYAALNDLDYQFSIFVSLSLIKPVLPYFNSKFAEIVMNSEIVFSQARERVTGIGTPDLHLIEIRDFRIPLPPLEEQYEIVRRVEALFKLADSLETKYSKAMECVEKIEQAVLAKAFRGELVEQDPNDEPADELLKKILGDKK